MKKVYLSLFLSCFAVIASAQTILDEGFESGGSTETYDPNIAKGWTTVDSYTGNVNKYRWHNYYTEKGTITGQHVAACDAVMGSWANDYNEAKGPKEEILVSPELNLDDTYQLSFDWKAASVSALDKQEYDFQVRVIVDGDVANAETIWSFHSEDDLRESGVTTFPWKGWQTYNSKLELTKWKGKAVKIAFVHKMLKDMANVVYLDNVRVTRFNAVSAPVPVLSRKIYSFGEVYVGSKVYSEAITLKNTGTSGLKIESLELPAGVTIADIDYASIDLKKNEEVAFRVLYTASMTSAADGNIIFHTNGGNVTLRVTAKKQVLPENATFEGFENGVPPTGWSVTFDGWRSTEYALEGDYSAYSTGSLEGDSELLSPRLDLSQGSQTLSFTYFNQYDSEDGVTMAENTIKVMLSTDGGTTWQQKELIDANDGFNAISRVSIELPKAGNNCYVKWVYSALVFNPEAGASPFSIFFLDNVVLPKIYGMDGVPAASTIVAPTDKAKDVFNKNVTFSWNRALFAQGYKLYVGTDDAASNLVNGEDLGDKISYTIDRLEYATTYNWKVVPYNANGEANDVAVWSFTTIPDKTVTSFPWSEGFEGTFPPLGWNIIKDHNTKWGQNDISPFDGKYSSSVSAGNSDVESTIETPEFALPADDPVQVTFYWGNAMPVALLIDETGMKTNTSTKHDGIDAVYFEVYVDGKWVEKAIISDKNNKYWVRERVDMSEYAGKKVAFRWRYNAVMYYEATGAAIDNIVVETVSSDRVSFNKAQWNAGKVNFNRSVSSGNIFSMINDGTSSQIIKSVTFEKTNFSSTLVAGTTLAAGEGVTFGLTFDALETASEVEDNMTVEFENGYSVKFPVKGHALASDTRYFGFEDDTYGNMNPIGFTTIDVDHKSTINLAMLNYENYGYPMAFMVMNGRKAGWNGIEPVSGEQCLVAFGADNYSSVDDWLVSGAMTATSQSRFEFYARNYANDPDGYWKQPTVSVLVSTTSATDTKAFTEVFSTILPFYDRKVDYIKYEVDLSKYAGQTIYVALRHYIASDHLCAFFDDLTFEHFSNFETSALSSIVAGSNVSVYPNPVVDILYFEGSEKVNVAVTSLSGTLMLKEDGVNSLDMTGLAGGIYLVTVETENGVYTTRIIKK